MIHCRPGCAKTGKKHIESQTSQHLHACSRVEPTRFHIRKRHTHKQGHTPPFSYFSSVGYSSGYVAPSSAVLPYTLADTARSETRCSERERDSCTLHVSFTMTAFKSCSHTHNTPQFSQHRKRQPLHIAPLNCLILYAANTAPDTAEVILILLAGGHGPHGFALLHYCAFLV